MTPTAFPIVNHKGHEGHEGYLIGRLCSGRSCTPGLECSAPAVERRPKSYCTPSFRRRPKSSPPLARHSGEGRDQSGTFPPLSEPVQYAAGRRSGEMLTNFRGLSSAGSGTGTGVAATGNSSVIGHNACRQCSAGQGLARVTDPSGGDYRGGYDFTVIPQNAFHSSPPVSPVCRIFATTRREGGTFPTMLYRIGQSQARRNPPIT